MHPREARTRSPIRRDAPEGELPLLGPALLGWGLSCVGCRLRLELLLGLLPRLLLLDLVPLGALQPSTRLSQDAEVGVIVQVVARPLGQPVPD